MFDYSNCCLHWKHSSVGRQEPWISLRHCLKCWDFSDYLNSSKLMWTPTRHKPLIFKVCGRGHCHIVILNDRFKEVERDLRNFTSYKQFDEEWVPLGNERKGPESQGNCPLHLHISCWWQNTGFAPQHEGCFRGSFPVPGYRPRVT